MSQAKHQVFDVFQVCCMGTSNLALLQNQGFQEREYVCITPSKMFLFLLEKVS